MFVTEDMKPIGIRKCPRCGKEFPVYVKGYRYAYTFNDKLYCSWTCFRAAQRDSKWGIKNEIAAAIESEHIRNKMHASDR